MWALSTNLNFSVAGGTACLEAGSWPRQPEKGDCLTVQNCYCVLPCWLIMFPIIKPRKQDQCQWSWSQSKIPGLWEKNTNYQSLHGLAISADKFSLSHCQLSLFVSDNVWKTKKIYINKNCTKPNSWRILGLLFNDGLFSCNNIYLILERISIWPANRKYKHRVFHSLT